VDPTIVTGLLGAAGIGATLAAPLLRDRQERDRRSDEREYEERLARRDLLDAAADTLGAARVAADTDPDVLDDGEAAAARRELLFRVEDVSSMQIKLEMRFGGPDHAVVASHTAALLALRALYTRFHPALHQGIEQRHAARDSLAAATADFARAVRETMRQAGPLALAPKGCTESQRLLDRDDAPGA
jgi:hypothetical protein